MKSDETQLWGAVVAGERPRDAGLRLGIHPKRVIYLCEKWTRQGRSLMMRNHADPGLITAYLALELERDPRIGMTTWQRIAFDITAAFNGVAKASAAARDALAAFPRPRQEDLVLWPPRS